MANRPHNRPHNHTLTKLTPLGVGEVASPQDRVQISPMVMDSRGEIMAHLRAHAKGLGKVKAETAEVVVAAAVAAAAAIVVTQTGGLFTPAAAKAPARM